MRHLKPMLGLSCVALVSVTLASCSSDLPSDSSPDVSQDPQTELSAAAKDQLLQRLGRGLAQALRDQAVRTWVRNEIAASPYVEYRIPLRDKVVNESGRAEMKAIGRNAALTGADVVQLRKFPHLELYMPLENQRASWRGGADIQVAVRRSTEDYILFQTNGSSRVVPENHMPTKPSLVLAVSEIDFGDRDGGLRGGSNTGDAMRAPASLVQATAAPSFSVFSALMPDQTQWTRSFSHFIVRQHDGGFAGDDEMELMGVINGFQFRECRRYTGLKANVQYFRNPTTPIPLSDAVALAVPSTPSDVLTLDAWEDDSGQCTHTTADDYYGSRRYVRGLYNIQVTVCIGNVVGDARLGVTEFVNGQSDFNSPSSVFFEPNVRCPGTV